MVFGAIIICGLISLCILGVAVYLIINFFADYEPRMGIVIIFCTLVALALTWCIPLWYYNNTASGKRALKTQDSNFNGGIQREIVVYDFEGDVIEKYSGKFDIEYSSERILFDDEDGNRHIVYFKTGTVIVTELPD